MGKATRWLKGIFGIKTTNNNPNPPPAVSKNENDIYRKIYPGDRKRTSSVKSLRSPEASWVMKSHYSEKEQSQHAIAVAAATAAAADAAVAAAQAAVAVVRLTSHGRGTVFISSGCGGGRGRGYDSVTEKWAAVKIQTTFRGYLARKALRALKGLVKIQALVRGYLVRKQATATLHGMQALIRAQATVRSKRAKSRISTLDHFNYGIPQSEFRARRSLDTFDDTRSEQAASIHSRRLSASFERRSIKPITDDIPKIVEIDPGRPRTPSKPYKSCNSPRPVIDPYDRDPCHPPHLSIPSCQHWQDTEWGLTGEECRFSTAHSTPRFINSGAVSHTGPITPSKSVCGDYSRQVGYYNQHPNYMANTQSFRSKVRSQSAPKQRPEGGQIRKKLSLNEMESRNSLSGVKMQRSCSQVQGAISFKNAVMGKLERSYDFSKDSLVYHLPRK